MALAVSWTCQTTTAAISIGLPSASLTLSWADSWLRIRVETTIRWVNGFTHCRPESRMVPRYRPNSCTTLARPGTTAVSPRSTSAPLSSTRMPTTRSAAAPAPDS